MDRKRCKMALGRQYRSLIRCMWIGTWIWAAHNPCCDASCTVPYYKYTVFKAITSHICCVMTWKYFKALESMIFNRNVIQSWLKEQKSINMCIWAAHCHPVLCKICFASTPRRRIPDKRKDFLDKCIDTHLRKIVEQVFIDISVKTGLK